MKKVKLNQLTEQVLLSRHESFSVEHDGKILGYFYPERPNKAKIPLNPQEALEGLRQLRSSLAQTDVVQIMCASREDLEKRGLF